MSTQDNGPLIFQMTVMKQASKVTNAFLHERICPKFSNTQDSLTTPKGQLVVVSNWWLELCGGTKFPILFVPQSNPHS